MLMTRSGADPPTKRVTHTPIVGRRKDQGTGGAAKASPAAGLDAAAKESTACRQGAHEVLFPRAGRGGGSSRRRHRRHAHAGVEAWISQNVHGTL
eukprot:scaffold80_cov106-Isochrysis_galbana.AAC.8